MCGIAGIVALNGNPVDAAVLQRMSDRLAHRGPDGEGFVVSTEHAGTFRHHALRHTDQWEHGAPSRVGLAHRRLAILDLSERGRQPMASADGAVWLVFNGEIYNHRELRARMEADGIRFRTRTDSEVLLHAYLRWGQRSIDHLDGMFAFAIWDGHAGRVFCARDRLGIKPFYYTIAGQQFLFASEIKALLAAPAVDARPDDDAVIAFLLHSNCDYGERTMFRHVKALPAAHVLTLDVATGSIAVKRYWDLLPRDAAAVGIDGDEARIARLRHLLVRTTHSHLVSDVRAGSCLSGGLDSSTVVSLIGKIQRDDPAAASAVGERLNTFTSCYEQPEFDEREYALSVATAAGATPHLVFPTAHDFWSEFERMAWHQDMPFGGFSYYAQWRVMKAVRDAGVKVLLDGQGGDEVFGGYAKFRYAYLMSLLRGGRLPMMLRELGGMVGQRDRYLLDLRRGYRYLPPVLRRLFNVDSLLQRVVQADWSRVIARDSTPATRWWRYAANRQGDSGWTLCQQVQRDDILVDTLPQLLRMEDRSSMAFSIEARVPLLDHRLVEFGISLPDRLKIRNGWSKFAMRQAMRNLMPDTVRLRTTKLGFAAPDRLWLADELRPHVSELISQPLRCAAYVNTTALRRWYASAAAGHANTESYLGLFRVLSLETWMRAFSL